VLILSIVGLMAQVIRVPYSSELDTFSETNRYELELLVYMPLEKALEYGFLISGQTIDFSVPLIRFMREWNLWLKIRVSNRHLNAADFLDAREIVAKNRARNAWIELKQQKEAEHQQWRRVKKLGDKLLKGE